MLTGYELEDGTQVETPLLDGVLERALELFDEWVEKKPDLVQVPESILLFQAIVAIDVKRMLDGFKKAGVNENIARSKVHSHLNERLMYMGIASFFTQFSFLLDQASNHYPIEGDPLAPPSNFDLRDPISEEDLNDSYEFNGMKDTLGEEATKHLLKAYIAFDREFRKLYKSFYQKAEENASKDRGKKKAKKKKPKE